MMLALRAALADYVTPENKAFSRAATTYINTCVAFLWDECRPACVSQRNSVKWLKKALVKVCCCLCCVVVGVRGGAYAFEFVTSLVSGCSSLQGSRALHMVFQILLWMV
jgi:hypothetical protein